MTSLGINNKIELVTDVLGGPEMFEASTITVVEGLKISPRPVEGEVIDGVATLFRLGGERFGEMHELTDLLEHDGLLSGFSTQPIDVGALVTIGWEDSLRCACKGVVAFSMRTGEGWRFTIDLDSALAA
jgi:hypothetical protein